MRLGRSDLSLLMTLFRELDDYNDVFIPVIG